MYKLVRVKLFKAAFEVKEVRGVGFRHDLMLETGMMTCMTKRNEQFCKCGRYLLDWE